MPLPGIRSFHLSMFAKLDGIAPIKRRQFLTIAAAIVGLTLGSAVQASSPLRIGWLWSGRSANNPSEVKGLQQGLKDLGYVEGKNIVIDYRFGEGSEDRMNDL